jgi:hypothetical protein
MRCLTGQGERFQDRREPVHGGFAKTSMFSTILKALPLPGETPPDRLWCVH